MRYLDDTPAPVPRPLLAADSILTLLAERKQMAIQDAARHPTPQLRAVARDRTFQWEFYLGLLKISGCSYTHCGKS